MATSIASRDYSSNIHQQNALLGKCRLVPADLLALVGRQPPVRRKKPFSHAWDRFVETSGSDALHAADVLPEIGQEVPWRDAGCGAKYQQVCQNGCAMANDAWHGLRTPLEAGDAVASFPYLLHDK